MYSCTHRCSETERRQDGRSGHVNVDTILLFVQLQIAQLVHRQRLERRMEERDRVQPLEHRGDTLTIDQQARE